MTRRVRYDLHIHSCLSPCGDADMTPGNIAGMAMLNGLRVAALTDHNTSKNCPAFFKICETMGIVPIAGMEITTVEEVHVVCLLPTLSLAMDFDAFVGGHRMAIANRPEIFGEQLIMNECDECIGKEDHLLIAATDLDIVSVAANVKGLGGVAFPAHIDKPSDSVLAMLGAIPPEPAFTAAEIFDISKTDELIGRYPELGNMRLISNSDAHMLESMRTEPPSFDEIEDVADGDELRRRVIAYLRRDL